MRTHSILDYSKENLGFNYILEEPTITLSEDYKMNLIINLFHL